MTRGTCLVVGYVLGVISATPAQAQVSAGLETITRPLTAPFRDSLVYRRAAWRHWIDADRDCQDTRQEVLIAESVVPVVLDARGCRVLRGWWLDPYTARAFHDPRELQIDHVVSLGWAFSHGGAWWDADRRQAFANDLEHDEHLVAVYGPANQSKGRLGPDTWRPENVAHWCDYGRAWAAIVRRWNLMMTYAEHAAVEALVATCAP